MNYYSYDSMISDASKLQHNYTGLIECETIGYSVNGRKIIMLRLGCGQKAVFISAGIHGRESINTYTVMRLIEYYAENYIKGSNLNHTKDLFNNISFYIVPLVNPDGYIKALTEKSSCDLKYNLNNIDINRNFPSILWKPGEASGNKPASQFETKALISAFKSHPAFMYIDLHSRGEAIYYYRKAMSDEYNKRQYIIAQILSRSTGYTLMQPNEEITGSDTGGNSVHYYSETFGMPAFTIETVADKEEFPLNIKLADTVFEQLKNILYTCFDIIESRI